MMQKVESKRERNKRERKERLYLAAVDLFRQQGFDETRVEEITQAAGVAKGTFFNYFPAKEDVLLYIGERHISRLGATLVTGGSERSELERSAVASLKSLMHTLAHSLEDDKDLVRLAVERVMKITYLAPDPADSRFSLQSLMAILIGQGQRSGEIHPDLDPAPVAQILEGLYYQQLVLWCRQNFAFDLGERLDQVIDLLLVGIAQRR